MHRTVRQILYAAAFLFSFHVGLTPAHADAPTVTKYTCYTYSNCPNGELFDDGTTACQFIAAKGGAGNPFFSYSSVSYVVADPSYGTGCSYTITDSRDNPPNPRQAFSNNWVAAIQLCPGGTATNPVGFYRNIIAPATCICNTGEKYFDDAVSSISKCVKVTQLPPGPTTPPNNPSDNGPHLCPSKDQPDCGQPINPGTNNMWHIERDYAAATEPAQLALRRTYNSSPYNWDGNVVRSFGVRWSQPYDIVLRPESPFTRNQPPGVCWQRADTGYIWCENPPPPALRSIPQAISITRGDGKKYLFNLVSGVWVGDSSANDRVTALYNQDNSAVVGWSYVSAQGDSIERFDANGRLISITARSGAMQRLTYSAGISNDSGTARIPADAPVCSNVQAGTTLPAGRLLCVTDHWGHQLQFEYDSFGRITRMIDPVDQSILYEYDGPSGGCMSHDAKNRACSANNLTKVTYPDGKSRTYYYNEAAQINGGTACPYALTVGNGFANLLNALTGLADENGARHITWTYDCLGRATSSQLAGGTEKVSFTYRSYNTDYSPDGSAMMTITHTLGTPANPQTTAVNLKYQKVLGSPKAMYVYQPCVECGSIRQRTYDANGNVVSTADWNGNTTNYTYDLSRNLETKRVEAAGTAQARTITTQWHTTYRLPVLIAEPKKLTTFTYDASGNLLSKTEQATSDATGAQGAAATVTGTLRTWNYTYNNVGQVLTETDSLNHITSYSYDNQGNLVTITNAAGHMTALSNYDANGRVGRITDPNGLTTDLTYNPRGWLMSKSVGGDITSYAYDGTGQLIEVTLPDDSTISYTYDDAHRLTSITDNQGNSISYTLDAMGNRTKEEVKDPNGVLTRQTTRVYDTLNRLQMITGGLQ